MMERAGLMEQQVPSGGRNSAIRGGGLYSTGKEFASMRSDPFWLLGGIYSLHLKCLSHLFF
jgi:hypothetical protein